MGTADQGTMQSSARQTCHVPDGGNLLCFPLGGCWGRGESDPPCGFLRHSVIILLKGFRDKRAPQRKQPFVI